jgi:hypothetical protein
MSNDNRPDGRTSADLSHYPAEKARQGEIILRRPWQRGVFAAGLIGCAVLLLLVALFSGSVR